MYYVDGFQKGDDIFDTCFLVCEVNLDRIGDNYVELRLRPNSDDIEIVREWYHDNDEFEGAQTIECFRLECAYDKEHDRIEISKINSFDKFVLNVCSLLGLGRITLFYNDVEEIERREHVSSISENNISAIILTLDEFKLLDGFYGLFEITGVRKVFKGFQMSIEALKELECDDFKRVDKRKEYLLRGENLFKWD